MGFTEESFKIIYWFVELFKNISELLIKVLFLRLVLCQINLFDAKSTAMNIIFLSQNKNV